MERKISETSGDGSERAFLFFREFRCWCSATTLYCYIHLASPWLHRLMICTQLCINLIFKLPRKHIYRVS